MLAATSSCFGADEEARSLGGTGGVGIASGRGVKIGSVSVASLVGTSMVFGRSC